MNDNKVCVSIPSSSLFISALSLPLELRKELLAMLENSIAEEAETEDDDNVLSDSVDDAE